MQHLGTHTEQGVKTPRLTYLQRYLKATALRQNWGEIDKVAVMREVEKQARAERRKAAR